MCQIKKNQFLKSPIRIANFLYMKMIFFFLNSATAISCKRAFFLGGGEDNENKKFEHLQALSHSFKIKTKKKMIKRKIIYK